MSFFSSVKGPELRELRHTFNNLCAATTQDERYKNGIDPDGVAMLLNDIYYYVTGSKDQRIRLPAPVDDPSDKFRVMWPEGAKVSSRALSTTSSKHSKVPSLSKSYTQKDVNRASSVVSSSIASKHRYVPMAGDSEDEYTEDEQTTKRYNSRSNTRHHSTNYRSEQESPLSFRGRQKRHGRENVVKMNNEHLTHSDSIEAIRAMRSNDIDDDNEDYVPPLKSRPPASRKVYNGPTIADN